MEKGRGDKIVGKLDAVLWRGDHLRVRHKLASSQQEIRGGLQIRCWAQLDFYGPAGRLQLIVRDVDPLFSLGMLERRRRATLAALAAAELLDRNRQLPLSQVPLEIGLVTSAGSAAFHDFLSSLTESPYAFRVRFHHAAMQGEEAERQVVAALAGLVRSAAARGSRLDAIVLVRGGGSRSDLAAFDSRRISEAVARCPLPVLTGLGHEIDQAIADRVSHAAFKTPTKVAEFLVERVAEADGFVEDRALALGHLARERLRRAEQEIRRCEKLAGAARLKVQAGAHAVRHAARTVGRLARLRLREAGAVSTALSLRLATVAPRVVDRRRERPERLARRLADVASGRLRTAEATLTGLARLCAGMAPERVLERGFSITRDDTGMIIREPSQARPGERISSTLAGGVLASRVEET